MTLRLIEITQNIREGLEGPERGLYVFLHRNPSHMELWDAPGGKMIAGGGDHLLKSGKYEGKGLRHRLTSYHDWTHPGTPRGGTSLFASYLEAAYIIPLEGVVLPGEHDGTNVPAAFEVLWNSAWRRWGDDEGATLPTQNRRTEYRRLRTPAAGWRTSMEGKGSRFAALLERIIPVMGEV
jgi:hypothetical protein